MDGTTRVVVLVRSAPPTPGLADLHRALGLGISEVRKRIQAGLPMLDAELFGNDHDEVVRVAEAILEQVQDCDFSIHECVGGDAPAAGNEVTAEELRQIVAGHSASPTTRQGA